MSVLIRGMEMPKSCYKCPLRRRDGMDIVCPLAHERFSVADVNILKYRLDNCPLVPVQPHGRLIDADALMARFEKEEKAADEHGRDFSFSFKSAGENCAEWWSVQQMLFYAPTIIPASEEAQT